MAELSEIAEITAGQGAPQGDNFFSTEGIPFIRAGSLDLLLNGGTLNDLEKISLEIGKQEGLRIFPKNSILFAKSGMSAMKDRVFVLPDEEFVVSHLAVIIPKGNLSEIFFKYWMGAFKPSTLIRDRAYPSIRLEDISKIKFPDFKIEEQQKIASILEQADTARQKRKQVNQLTEQFLQSAFIEMFGDPVRNEKNWEVKRLEDISDEIQIGPFGTQLHEEDYIENGIPLINPKHIVDGKIEIDFGKTITKEKFKTLSNYHLKTGDVIMGRRGEMGRCALITDKEDGWLCGTGSLFIRPNKNLNSQYLIFVISNPSFVKKLENSAQGVTMMNLNLTIIKNLPISFPPHALQQKFASLVERVEKLREKQMESERELENLFQALMQKYFA